MIEKDYPYSGLDNACFHGDGPFFIEKCKELGILLNLSEMDESKIFRIFQSMLIKENIEDIIYFLNLGIKINNEDHKKEILKRLETKENKDKIEELKKLL